jgi:hypothetical protein
MPTNRVPISRQRSSVSLPDEAVSIYQKMMARLRADDEWWQLHNQLVDLLNPSPHVWPLLPAPGEAPVTKFQQRLQRQLEEALSEQNEPEPVQYS